MSIQAEIGKVKSKFNLDLAQIDDASNQAIHSLTEYLNGYHYEFNEDGVNILSSEDEIVEMSDGKFPSKWEFEKEVNLKYLLALEQFAALV